MELLLAIKNYCDKLIEYGFYPKKKKPSLGKLEKMADLCMAGKFQKLARYVPKNATGEQRGELAELLEKIREVVNNEKNNK